MAPSGGLSGASSPAKESDSIRAIPGSPRTLPSFIREQDEKPILESDGNATEDTDFGKNGIEEKDPEAPASRFIIDPAGPLTHDLTTVDIVTVPCPGGHPLRTWSRDGLLSRYFGAPSMRDAEVDGSERNPSSWVRQGIRREADMARILLYAHPVIEEGTSLGRLADALLKELQDLRTTEDQQRPLLIIGHSIGGIVAKMALVKASRDSRFESIWRDCYGLAFFGTPHQGSSYFAMPSLSSGIQNLLQLSQPLPSSITDDLRVANSLLAHVDEDFKAISSDLRIWTFYETIDSRLSGGNGSQDVYFTAPLASIKSAILGMRQERIFPLQSDHANIASFGRHNVQTLRLFLRQLAAEVRKADVNARIGGRRWTLGLEQKVNVEVHGFFEDPVAPGVATSGGVIRAWSTRLPLKEFLTKGPDECLTERLNEVDGAPEEGRFLRVRGRTSLIDRDEDRKAASRQSTKLDKNALGIRSDGMPVTELSPPGSPIIRPIDSTVKGARTESAPELPPPSNPITPPTRPISPFSRNSTSMRRPSPLIRADFEQDLAVDRLSPPSGARSGRSLSRSHSDASHFEYRDFPPFSQRSKTTIDVGMSSDDDDGGIEASPPLPEAVIAIRKVAKNTKKKTSETVIVDEVAVAFAKPEASARKFVWIHLPYNNPSWVKDILQTLQVTYKRDFSSLYGSDFWATRHTRGRHSQHYADYAKPGCYFSAPHPLSPRSHSFTSTPISPSPGDDNVYTCVFLPYLHFDSYRRLVRRRDLILRRLAFGRAGPVPEYVAKCDSLELQVIWEHLGEDPPLNTRRTLDQYGYPSLRDTRARDDDQMLYKLTKERTCAPAQSNSLYQHGSSGQGVSDGSWNLAISGSGSDTGQSVRSDSQDRILNGNVLMVDQLWMWALNSHTLLSFFPKRESDPIEGPLYQQADLRDSIFNEVNVDLTRKCENALDLAALAALHAVSVLLDRSSHPDLEVFRIFEEAISVLTEKLTSSLKTFRTEGFRDKAHDYEPVENRERFIRARHKEQASRAEQENRDNTSALLELRDIEDELLILLHLFERQTKVMSSMHATYTRAELRDVTVNGRVFLNEAIKKLSEYSHQADEMIQRVRNTRDDYDKLLQMVQRQAQVDEVRLSRFHADLASAQGRSVMIFTVFTVIFLPLSFFTSLFGMNTLEWGGENNMSLRTIGAISLPASALLIITTLFMAWSTHVRQVLRWANLRYRRVLRWWYIVMWRPVGKWMIQHAKKGRGKIGKGVQGSGGEEAEENLKRETSDFWERHRLERERGYQIPEVNRKSAAKTGSWARAKKESRER